MSTPQEIISWNTVNKASKEKAHAGGYVLTTAHTQTQKFRELFPVLQLLLLNLTSLHISQHSAVLL